METLTETTTKKRKETKRKKGIWVKSFNRSPIKLAKNCKKTTIGRVTLH
jgi:hypothetical protein